MDSPRIAFTCNWIKISPLSYNSFNLISSSTTLPTSLAVNIGVLVLIVSNRFSVSEIAFGISVYFINTF